MCVTITDLAMYYIEAVGGPSDNSAEAQQVASPKKKKQPRRRESTFNILQARQHLFQMEEEMRKANEEEERKKKDDEAKAMEKEKKEKEKEKERERGRGGAGGQRSSSEDSGGDEAAREKAIIKGLYGNLRLEALESDEDDDAYYFGEGRENDGDDEGEEERMVPMSRLKRMEREERFFIKALCELRNKLDDANLRIMNKAMKEVLTFYELIQLSDRLITSVTNEAKDLLKTKGLRNPSLACLAIDLLLEICLLMHRCNDFSVGINQPTIEKLEAFKKKFAAREAAAIHRQSRALPPQKPAKGGGGGFFSFFK